MTDNEIKKLMKKSLLHVPEKDFTEKVMERIHAEAVDKTQSSRDIKLSWLCITLAAFILPFGLKFIFRLLSLYDPYLVRYLQKFSDNIIIQIGFVLLMTAILLFQLDNLLQMAYAKRKWSPLSLR
jgi:hypothetical protein